MAVFDERSPIYRQIADQIRSDILSGVLRNGEKVMSSNEYASFYRINPATATKAFKTLIDEGVLMKRRGVGMFVAPDARDLLRERHRERFFEEMVDPMVARAELLGVPLSQVIERIRRQTGGGTS
ncbi:GntR family transcriptional regulator [Nocardiopsis dassonvillei]|uniref:GntR family transcriptional regulator n=1 Tax=Nocardiopsis dassonvillei TaxID=2014 RepID=UPI002010BE02|nr:GntR family transcriptional regulator [Nocardiopsis dassonvillei]MCK9874171.1 GntR family transcriptional regulator [Nocardiopsis dassonvillei]